MENNESVSHLKLLEENLPRIVFTTSNNFTFREIVERVNTFFHGNKLSQSSEFEDGIIADYLRLMVRNGMLYKQHGEFTFVTD